MGGGRRREEVWPRRNRHDGEEQVSEDEARLLDNSV